MAKYSDVCVRVSLLIEGVDHDRRAGRAAAPKHQATWLLKFGVQPWKERRQCACVQDAVALESIDGGRTCGQVGVEHPELARLQVAENRACGCLDPLRARFEGL